MSADNFCPTALTLSANTSKAPITVYVYSQWPMLKTIFLLTYIKVKMGICVF